MGGLLTVPITWLVARAWRRSQGRKFKRVFGLEVDEFHLAYGSLVIRPEIMDLLASVQHGENYRSFPFAKPSIPEVALRSESVAPGCEIRAAAYVANALGRFSRIRSSVMADEAIKDRLDLDFISFGMNSNLKTLDLCKNRANCFADFDRQGNTFVGKRDGEIIYQAAPSYDFGLIIKIHPEQYPHRTWIACAGNGEWGTSGTAYFLANKWSDLLSYLNGKDKSFTTKLRRRLIREDRGFLAVIRVEIGKDESAALVAFYED